MSKKLVSTRRIGDSVFKAMLYTVSAEDFERQMIRDGRIVDRKAKPKHRRRKP